MIEKKLSSENRLLILLYRISLYTDMRQRENLSAQTLSLLSRLDEETALLEYKSIKEKIPEGLVGDAIALWKYKLREYDKKPRISKKEENIISINSEKTIPIIYSPHNVDSIIFANEGLRYWLKSKIP